MSRSGSTTYPVIVLIAGEGPAGDAALSGLRDQFGVECVSRYLSAGPAAVAALRDADVAVVLDGAGVRAPEAVGTLIGVKPAVAVLGAGDGAGVVDAMDRGAADAVAVELSGTGWVSATLVPALERALARAGGGGDARVEAALLRADAEKLRAEKASLERAVSRLEAMAWTDPVTGLANRHQIEERLPQMFAEAVRYGTDLACILIDLDNFKRVNDTYGHAEGDEVLRAMGKLIEAQIRASDIAARYGGDEFLVLMPRSGCGTAERVVARLFAAFRARFCDAPCSCGMSVGIACVKRNAPLDGPGLVNMADLAMYASKKAGRDRVMVCVPGGGFEEVRHGAEAEVDGSEEH